ncbi:MAG: hypothetical protein AAB426_01025 [Myxococcota bacterium]
MSRHLAALFALFLGVVPAQAQTLDSSTPFFGGTGLSLTLLHPNDADGRLDCIVSEDHCAPLNAAACVESPPRAIELYVTAQNTAPLGSDLIIWLQKSDGECVRDFRGEPGDTVLLGTVSLDVESDPLVSAARFEFPADSALGTYTTAQVLASNLLNGAACAADTRVDRTWFRLCFGVDGSLTTSPDNNIEATEPNAWMRLIVDTKAPATPAVPRVVSLDGRLEVSVESSDSDVFEWRTFTVAREEGAELPTPSCDGWRSAHRTEVLGENESFADDVELTNGRTYDVWVCAVDALGNVSEPSPMSSGTPTDQCDFIECYPGALRGGYCSASGQSASLAWLLVVGLAVLRRGRAR